MALDDKQVLEQYRDRDKDSSNSATDFFKEGAKAWGYYAGPGQWEAEDRAKLKAEGRPALTINNIKPIVDVVAGSEITTRFMPKFRPRKAGTEAFADLLSEQVRYIRDQTNAEQEESRAFKEALVTGMGCCEIRQDHTDDREGIQKIECVPIFEMGWDPAARRTNVTDSRYVIRKKRIHKNDFKFMFPDDADLTSGDMLKDTGPPVGMGSVEITSHMDAYETAGSAPSGVARRGTIPVAEYQWWDLEDYWCSVNLQDGTDMDFKTEKEAMEYQAMVLDYLRGLPPEQRPQVPPVVKLQRRKYERAFIAGGRLLEHAPLPLQKHFTFQFITCFEDINEERTKFFGLIRGAMDPQSAYNKFVSQMIHIVSVNPKGVLGWETGAFANTQKALNQWSNPAGQIEFQPGGLSKVQVFNAAKVPEGLQELSSIAKGAIPEATGVNVNYMGGQAEDLRRTAGSVVQAIQRQGMVVLSPAFDALRLFRKEGARTLQEYIKLYWSEGRSFRLTGNQFAQYTKDAAMHEYDVIVDEVPTSVNQQQEVWNSLIQTDALTTLTQAGMLTGDIIADLVPGIGQDLRDRMKMAYQQKMMAQQQAPQTPAGQSGPGGEAAPPQGG